MFIDTIEEKYPKRVLSHFEVRGRGFGFTAYFKLPKKHRVTISLILVERDENNVTVHETVQEEDDDYNMPLSQVEVYPVDIHATSKEELFFRYLKIVIGKAEKHVDDGTFALTLLKRVLEK